MEQELLRHLLAAAISLSGLPPVDIADLPPILRLSHAEMTREVCPEDPQNCRGMASFYDIERQRILIDEALDLSVPEQNSFVVHELVHVLQFKQRGDKMYEDCVESTKTEAQAYEVQNAYLHQAGRYASFSQKVAFADCPNFSLMFTVDRGFN